MKVLNMGITVKASVKVCQRFIRYTFLSDTVRVCWKHGLCAEELLTLYSVHPKAIKPAIGKHCLGGAFQKCCPNTKEQGFLVWWPGLK